MQVLNQFIYGEKERIQRGQSAIFEKTIFSGRCFRVAVWNLLQSFGNWRKYDFSGARSIVTVHYKGSLIDGQVFDNSYERTCPDALRLSDVIEGWQVALQKMHVGDKWIIYIPYAMGYGIKSFDSIPAYSTLIFEVELLGVA